MLKKLCLSVAFAALSFASLTASTDRITALKSSIAHIEQAMTDSMIESKISLEIINQSMQHLQNKLGDSYESTKAHVVSLLNTIIDSNEFDITLNGITDRYMDCVVNQYMNFNDIVINSTDYPLEGRIDTVLTKASPALNEQATQMFNVFYVTIAIVTSSKLFCAKLDLKKNELLAELAALQATN